MRTSAKVGVVLVVVSLFPWPRAHAGSATAQLGITAAVANNCTISTSALAFGTYDPVVDNASTDLDQTGTITTACTKGASTTICLDLGSNASGSQRRLAGSGNFLNYAIFQDAARSKTWGNSGGDCLSPQSAPSKAARDFTAYGRVDKGQDVPAASYSDTVTATVNF